MRWPILLTTTLALAATGPEYRTEIEKWRADREIRLKAEDGWLSVAGLYWLKAGDNRIGKDANATVSLPRGPVNAGTLRLADGKVELAPVTGTQVNGRPAGSKVTLKADKDGEPDVISVEDMKLFVIARGSRLGIRLKDPQSEYRRGFTGLVWFPVKDEWRITAKWVAYPQPKTLSFDSMTGDKQEGISPGYAVFTIGGKQYKLEPTQEDQELFFVFRDRTAGKSTYPAARFLRTPLAKDGTLVLDFNKAYNPPCVFTPYATCPLPTPMNRLPIPIEAGEKMYGKH